MRFLNMLGNRIFARLLKWIMGQQVKDTLCGTKVLLAARLRADRRRPLLLRRVRPVRRLRPALRRGPAQPEDRRPARPLPAAHVRRDEHQPLAPRRAAPPDDGLRVLEVQGRTTTAPRDLTGARAWVWAPARARARARARDRCASIVAAQPLRSPWWTYADADARYTGAALNLVARRPGAVRRPPGLPLTEAAASSTASTRVLHRATSRGRIAAAYVDRACSTSTARADLPWALAALLYLAGAALAFVLLARLLGHWTWGLADGCSGSRAGDRGDVDPAPPRRCSRALLPRLRIPDRPRGRGSRRTPVCGCGVRRRIGLMLEAARDRAARPARARGGLAAAADRVATAVAEARLGDRRGRGLLRPRQLGSAAVHADGRSVRRARGRARAHAARGARGFG